DRTRHARRRRRDDRRRHDGRTLAHHLDRRLGNLLDVVALSVLERLEKLAHGITARRSDSKRFTTPASWLRTRPTVATASASVGVLANQWDRRREFNRLPMDRTRRCVGMPCSMYSIASLTDDRSIRRVWSA